MTAMTTTPAASASAFDADDQCANCGLSLADHDREERTFCEAAHRQHLAQMAATVGQVDVERAVADADAAREDADRLALEASNADRAARELEAEADALQATFDGRGRTAEPREYPVAVYARAKDLVDLLGALEAGDLEAAKAAAHRAGIYQAVA